MVSMVEDDASRDTVIPTPHGQARMDERAVSIEELQRAKMYGTITRARDGRDGEARWKVEHEGIVYITDWTQRLVISTYRVPLEADEPRVSSDSARMEALESEVETLREENERLKFHIACQATLKELHKMEISRLQAQIMNDAEAEAARQRPHMKRVWERFIELLEEWERSKQLSSGSSSV